MAQKRRAARHGEHRLAALGGESADQNLRLSRDEARRLQVLRDGIASAKPAGELGYRHGATVAQDIILLRAAVLEQPLPAGWATEAAKGAGATFPMRAADIADRYSGPDLGKALRRFESAWIASGFELSREQMIS